jgi:hypothetical protein
MIKASARRFCSASVALGAVSSAIIKPFESLLRRLR